MKYFLSLLLLFTTLATAAQQVEVNTTGFYIKKKPVTKATTTSELRDLLGLPDRMLSLANVIWTYDRLGIYVYLNPADSSLKHISFDLVKHEQKFSPLKTFTGLFSLNKNTLSRYTSLERLMKMKSLRFEINPVWRQPAFLGPTKLYFEFDDTKKLLRSVGVALIFKEAE